MRQQSLDIRLETMKLLSLHPAVTLKHILIPVASPFAVTFLLSFSLRFSLQLIVVRVYPCTRWQKLLDAQRKSNYLLFGSVERIGKGW